jgi:hypothetical protein
MLNIEPGKVGQAAQNAGWGWTLSHLDIERMAL